MQNSIPTDETLHAALPPLSWGGASISGPLMREEPVAVVQAHLLRNPTSQKPSTLSLPLGDTSKAPWGLKPIQLLSHFLSAQKWVVWIQAGASWLGMRVWDRSGHTVLFLPALKCSSSPHDPWHDGRGPRVTVLPCPPSPKRFLCDVSPMWLLAKFGPRV